MVDLDDLRCAVSARMGADRFAHTLGVERAAVRMGEIYMPDRIRELRIAALLHDVTKNETVEKQLQYLEKFGIMEKDFYKRSPSLLHALTGSLVITENFAEYVSDDIISAVRWHTTGRWGMTDFETVIYLADLIEDGRSYSDLAKLRCDFWDASFDNMSASDRQVHLYRAVVKSVDNTVLHLLKKGAYISSDSVDYRNYCLMVIQNLLLQ